MEHITREDVIVMIVREIAGAEGESFSTMSSKATFDRAYILKLIAETANAFDGKIGATDAV